MIRVGITGGIGSGKSVVCRLLAMLGAPIYDCDSEAKRLMNSSEELHRALAEHFGDEIFGPHGLDRKALAGKVFGDGQELATLNSIVHPAVARDFERWAARNEAEGQRWVVMESAILFESGFDSLVDLVVGVVAPEELRVERAMLRDGATEEAVSDRMAAQMSTEELVERADRVVINDESRLLWPQVLELADQVWQMGDRK